MQLLCLGDIAIGEGDVPVWEPPLPEEEIASGESRVMLNWELPLGDALNPTPRSSGPRLLAHPQSLVALAKWAPGFAALATNHILDAGEQGLAQTLAMLHGAGFATTGAGRAEDEIRAPLLWEGPEGRLAIVNWVFPETHPDWMATPGPHCWPGAEEARRTIGELKAWADWVLVLVHWSDELFPYPRPEDRIVAQQLARMGADLVVGHHPHVVRGMEVIGACPVFYSLGNLYFSDIADGHGGWIVKGAPRNREGLGLWFSFRRGQPLAYRAASFWKQGRGVISDPLDRAARRLAWASRPLARLQGEAYAAWYAIRRARFDQWGARWHFGARRLGVWGTVRRLARLLRRQRRGAS